VALHEGVSRTEAALLTRSFFRRDAVTVARDLIGCFITVDGVGGLLVETEAYNDADPASHSYLGRRTTRNWPMFGEAAHAYVYRSYGLHWCLNFVTEEVGQGSAVLVRAFEPLWGIERMQERRGVSDVRRLAKGPGCVCQALAIDNSHNGISILDPPFDLRKPALPVKIIKGPRIGISVAQEKLWRFGLRSSPFLSKSFPTPR
jgi:DNA-3-methyladenine glycosylase